LCEEQTHEILSLLSICVKCTKTLVINHLARVFVAEISCNLTKRYVETGRLLDDTFQGRLTIRKPTELRPHAAYVDICGEPSELKPTQSPNVMLLGRSRSFLYRHTHPGGCGNCFCRQQRRAIKAFVSCRDPKPPSLIELKHFCAENLPLYMIPDSFSWHAALPKTSTDKLDYQRLREMA
jgi:hypothetical protein